MSQWLLLPHSEILKRARVWEHLSDGERQWCTLVHDYTIVKVFDILQFPRSSHGKKRVLDDQSKQESDSRKKKKQKTSHSGAKSGSIHSSTEPIPLASNQKRSRSSSRRRRNQSQGRSRSRSHSADQNFDPVESGSF